jgi:hypothetical protein
MVARRALFLCGMVMGVILLFGNPAGVWAAAGVEVNGDLNLTGTGAIIFPDGSVQTTASAPTWSQKLPCDTPGNCARFVTVLDGAGVLDKETGLVWAQSPDTTTRTWDVAASYCYGLNLGGRGGWRLPTITELMSLVYPTNTNPSLPEGHPFANVQSGYYWSSTTYAANTDYVWAVAMGNGFLDSGTKGTSLYVWPVRGGQ